MCTPALKCPIINPGGAWTPSLEWASGRDPLVSNLPPVQALRSGPLPQHPSQQPHHLQQLPFHHAAYVRGQPDLSITGLSPPPKPPCSLGCHICRPVRHLTLRAPQQHFAHQHSRHAFLGGHTVLTPTALRPHPSLRIYSSRSQSIHP